MLYFFVFTVLDEKKDEEATRKKSLFSRFGSSKENKSPVTPPNTPVLTSPTTETATQGKHTIY